MIETEDARCNAKPTPCSALITTSSSPVRENPWPSINAPLARDPTSSTHRGPTVSAMDPASKSVEAVARLLTDDGQNDRDGGNWRSLVIVGRPTITNPLTRQAVSVTAQSCSITKALCRRIRRGFGGGTSAGSCNSNGSICLVVVVWVADIVKLKSK